jgi:Leucine-rich repeat (LRR) protein
MKMIKFSLILTVILLITNKSSAASATCKFQTDTSTSLSGTTQSYSCELTIYNSGEVTQINGNHDSGYDNSDVKILSIDIDQTLTKFSSIFCLKFSNLETIKLSDSNLELIDSNSLQNCQNLKILKFNKNKINGLAENLLSRNTKLTFLQLDSNEIFSLPENLFANNNQLEALDLSNNQINYLPDNIFKSLSNLKNLWLVGNKLTTLNPLWFKNLRNLEVLYADNNEIVDLPWGIFGPLRNLESLGLSANQLKKVHSDWFGQHRNLKALGLSENQITEFDERILDKTALDKLDMAENVCCEDYIINENQIKDKMRKCFANYQPREVPKEVIGRYSENGKELVLNLNYFRNNCLFGSMWKS